MIERKPHRQICGLCHRVCRVDFSVPNHIWKLAVHSSQKETPICLECFTTLADERMVDWGNDIKFYPCSQVQHIRNLQAWGISLD